jgi:hypothetical protein
MNTHPYGFRIVGATTEARRLTTWAAAFSAHAACDPRARLDYECYLSAFLFGDDFRQRADAYGKLNVKGYAGECWSPFIWCDIDRAQDLNSATTDARSLAVAIGERYKLADDLLLIFFSGSKGYHIGVPTWLWSPDPSITFNAIARRFAETLAASIGVVIDSGVYDKVRAFRAPNSRHQKTGLHKRRLSLDELLNLSSDRIVELAREPAPFDVREPLETSQLARDDWQVAIEAVERQAAVMQQRRIESNGTANLNRATLEFIRDGATAGDRHRMLFSAAANLAEFGCTRELAHALLTEAGLDSGLPPSEVRRQINCGLADNRNGGNHRD